MPTCSICSHPDRTTIDEALISGASLREAESHWGVSRSALHRHRSAHLPAPEDVPAKAPGSDLAAAYRELAASARRAFEAAMKAGRTQDASNSLRAWETALAKLTDLEAPKAAAQPAAPAQPPPGLSDAMARAIMVQTLGLSDEQADRMLSGVPRPTVAAFKPDPTTEERATQAVERSEARAAEPPKPAAPRRREGPIRIGGDPMACACDPDDFDADCPQHGGIGDMRRRGGGLF